MTCAINSVLDIFKMLCRDDSHGRHGHCIPCIARVQTGYVHKFLMGKNINRYFIYSGVRGEPVWGAVMSVWGTWSPADITAFITGPNKAGLSNWDLVVHCAHKQLRIFMTNDATPTITKWWHSNVVGISCVLMCQVICPAAYNKCSMHAFMISTSFSLLDSYSWLNTSFETQGFPFQLSVFACEYDDAHLPLERLHSGIAVGVCQVPGLMGSLQWRWGQGKASNRTTDHYRVNTQQHHNRRCLQELLNTISLWVGWLGSKHHQPQQAHLNWHKAEGSNTCMSFLQIRQVTDTAWSPRNTKQLATVNRGGVNIGNPPNRNSTALAHFCIAYMYKIATHTPHTCTHTYHTHENTYICK